MAGKAKVSAPVDNVRRIVWEPHRGPQTLLFKCPADVFLYGGAKGGGKLGPLDEPVITPFGERKLGDLKVGNLVCNPDGTNATVVGVHPQGVKEIYRVKFHDGSYTDCGLEHLWAIRKARQHKSKRGVEFRIFPTSKIIEWLRERHEVMIPVTQPVTFTKSYKFPQIKIDPYSLGVLLGDGSLGKDSVTITCADKGIIQKLKIKTKKIRLSDKEKCPAYRVKGLRDSLRELGLLGKRAWEKHIPKPYLLAAVKDRWNLLRGLMDTDGTSGKSGRISFSTTSPMLSRDVRWLVQSLGGIVTTHERFTHYRHNGELLRGRKSYVLNIKFRDRSQAFHLERKKTRANEPWTLYRRITSVRKIGRKKAVCITVDHPNGLYLTREFIVTHNSTGGIVWCAQDLDRDGYSAIFFRKTYKELELDIIPRSFRFFDGIGSYDGKSHKWTFKTPGGGKSFLHFGYLQHENDVFTYSGGQFARMFVDESTQHSERTIRHLLTCVRTAVEGIKPQMALGANPIGPGFGWHKSVFVKDRKPYELYNDARWPSDKQLFGLTTCFIPARVWDNPTLLKNDPNYPQRLRTQHGAITEALLHGSWEHALNLAIDFDETLNTCEPVELGGNVDRWIGIDWGVTHNAAAVWLARDHRRLYFTRDHGRVGKDIRPFAKEVIELSKDKNGRYEEIAFVVLSHECFSNHGMGNTQADQFMEVFDEAKIPVVKSDRDPVGRLTMAREFLRLTPIVPGGQDSSAMLTTDYEYWAERFRKEGATAFEEYRRITSQPDAEDLPKVLVFRPGPDGQGCPNVIRTFPLMVTDKDNSFKLADDQEDDFFDAATYGMKAYYGPKEPTVDQLMRNRLKGRMPDSELGSELLLRSVRQELEGEEMGPVRWRTRRFE